jgi:hypothetical protein
VASEYEVLGYGYEWGDWDCSKFVEQILTDCGIQVERCRSIDYAHGRCGFESTIVEIAKREGCDFAFWTWPKRPDRPFGHTGMFERPELVWHNSGSEGTLIKAGVGTGSYLLRHLKRVRRLDIVRGGAKQ